MSIGARTIGNRSIGDATGDLGIITATDVAANDSKFVFTVEEATVNKTVLEFVNLMHI